MLQNIHISNDNGSFTFYVDVFFPLSLPRLLPDLTVYMSNTTGVFYEAGIAYPSSSSPGFWWGFCSSSFYFLCVVLLCVLTFCVPCCDVRYDFRLKRCSIRLLKQRPTHTKHMTSFPLIICVRIVSSYFLYALFCRPLLVMYFVRLITVSDSHLVIFNFFLI